MHFNRPLVLLAFAALSLSACGEIREDLGLGRNPPDEFSVVERPPLSLPPDYGLRPPRPGASRPQEVATDQQANAAIYGGRPTASSTTASKTEKALLEASGASKSDPSIRETVNRESAQKATVSEHLIEKLVGADSGSDPTVDAKAEAERLRKAREENKPVNAGATPIIEKQSTGWLGF